ncbi:hypothetical protein HMPREF9607_01830 [Cutibacterium modestum HL044PA1]|uniref:Uncharacterized protein n=1 Tax=Cutibacterium modestum HL044PA1 TaxID=765109 RepID=A0ABN0C4A2_9ACTN|nr:hypothetical protein HMPREF9607_01830 [Cutibacterium modestum HL044PA1]
MTIYWPVLGKAMGLRLGRALVLTSTLPRCGASVFTLLLPAVPFSG